MKENPPSQSGLNSDILLKQAQLLAGRLEKITPDSSWAHRASGHRRVLLRHLRLFDGDLALPDLTVDERRRLRAALENGYAILERAAKERLNKAAGE